MSFKNTLNKTTTLFICSILLILFSAKTTTAQSNQHQIAVFSPIYIDSAFNGNTYKLWGNYLPKNMMPGLEFYNGVSMAIDSLKNTATSNLIINIYDYKSKQNSLKDIIADSNNNLDSASVMIASFNNRNDIKILADYAKQKQIPLISATYPNDGGVVNNPYFFLLNSTLHTHCKALHKYIQKHSAASNIIYVTRKGGFETMVADYFTEFDSLNLQTALHLQPKVLADSFYSSQLLKTLDSTKQNIVFCGTVNEAFALKIASIIAAQKKYKATLIGMPTWDALKGLDKNDYKGIEFIYTSPYNFIKNDLVNNITTKYKNKYTAKPSDLVFKGYETMLRLCKTISLYGNNAIQLFGDDMFKVINSLEIQAVYNKTIPTQIDYYENKKIYFISKLDGALKSIN